MPLRALIVDDHPPSLLVLRLALESRGAWCQEATTIARSLVWLATSWPDVVFFEWRLRSGDAHGFARDLRALAADRGDIPTIVALSTQPEPEGFRAREAVDAYLMKPLVAEQLDAVLHSVVTRR